MTKLNEARLIAKKISGWKTKYILLRKIRFYMYEYYYVHI